MFQHSKKKIDFLLELDNEKGNKSIYIDNLICGYDKFQTISFSLNIDFGSKINRKGPNGSGKTTFIKKTIEGNIVIENDVKIGYISQNIIIDNKNISGRWNRLFISFYFNYDNRDKKYFELSFGQRTRINSVKNAFYKINILILDEITNHLDKEALDLIYELVESYPGTIIGISHNRKYNKILNSDYSLCISTGNIEYLKK